MTEIHTYCCDVCGKPPLGKTLGGAFSDKTRRVLFYCAGCQKIAVNFVQFDYGQIS